MSSILCYALTLVVLQTSCFFSRPEEKTEVAVLVENDISKLVGTELSRHNGSRNMTVLSVKSKDSLSKLVMSADGMTKPSRFGLVFSFLDITLASMLKEIAGYENFEFLGYDCMNCQMIKTEFDENAPSCLYFVYHRNFEFLGYDCMNCQMKLTHGKSTYTCKNYRDEYDTAIRTVIEYFQFRKIVIISSNDSCEKKLADELHDMIAIYQKESKDDIHGHFLLKKYEFNNDVINKREISNIIYETRFLDASIVVLICQSDIANVVFEVATKFSMLSYNRVWLTFDYETKVKVNVLPLQFINIVGQRLQNVEWEAEQVINMSIYAAKIMKAKRRQLIDGSVNKDERRVKQDFASLSEMFTSQKCPNANQIQVLYRIKSGKWVEIFTWKQNVGVVLTSTNTELHNIFTPAAAEKAIKVVTILDSPFTEKAHQFYKTNPYKEYPCEKGVLCRVPFQTTNHTRWNRTCCIGHSMDLLDLLSKDFFFTPDVYVVEDGYYGSKVDGKWNGMIGDLYNKKADIAMAGLTISNSRSAVVDFTTPFLRVELGIIISTRNQLTNVLNFSFLSYISDSLLWALLGIFIFGLVVVYFFENERNICNSTHRTRPKRRPDHFAYSWRESFTYFSGLTFQRDLGGKNPTQFGAQVTAVIFAFSMVVTMTAYTAVLTASNVKQEERNPFLGIKDERMRNPTKNFKFATVSATATETFFRETADPVLHRMYLFMKNYNTKTTLEGIHNVETGKLQGFVNENTFLKHYVSKQRECVLRIVDLSIDHISYGIAVRKGSRWRSQISNAIHKYRDNGKILQIDKKWLSGVCSSPTNKTGQHESYSAQYFGGLFVIVLSASVFSVLVLGFEHVYEKYYERPRTTSTTEFNVTNMEELGKEQGDITNDAVTVDVYKGLKSVEGSMDIQR